LLTGREAESALTRKALDVHAAQNRALHAAISHLQQSTSWRITAPLRSVRKMAGRAKLSAAGFALMQSWRALRARSRVLLYNWRAAALIAKSDLFDADWYERRNPDVADWGLNPVRHYIAYGAAEGRDPSPKFDTSWYLRSYSDGLPRAAGSRTASN
jgi:hypothetical protein